MTRVLRWGDKGQRSSRPRETVWRSRLAALASWSGDVLRPRLVKQSEKASGSPVSEREGQCQRTSIELAPGGRSDLADSKLVPRTRRVAMSAMPEGQVLLTARKRKRRFEGRVSASFLRQARYQMERYGWDRVHGGRPPGPVSHLQAPRSRLPRSRPGPVPPIRSPSVVHRVRRIRRSDERGAMGSSGRADHPRQWRRVTARPTCRP
jgi:hypothetical protein